MYNLYDELLKYVEKCENGICMHNVAPVCEPVLPVPQQPAQLAQAAVSVTKDELLGMIKQAVKEALTDARVEVPATFTIKGNDSYGITFPGTGFELTMNRVEETVPKDGE